MMCGLDAHLFVTYTPNLEKLNKLTEDLLQLVMLWITGDSMVNVIH